MVNIKDISKGTGFSVTTVSRALNDHSDVNEETKEIIRQSAKKLNYVPNLNAKNLVNKKSKTIGYITNRLLKGNLIDNFVISIFLGMFDTSNTYEVILIHYDSDFFNSKSFDSIVRERQLEGVVVQGFDEDASFIKEVLSSSCPSILIDIGLENENTSYVSSDIQQAFWLGIEAIEQLDFKTLTFVKGKNESYSTSSWMKEVDKYIQNNPNKKIKLVNGGYTEECARNAVIEEISQSNHSDIYFCFSDLMAIGVYDALREFNLKIPDDVSVLGYDGILLGQYITPKLSSIAQDLGKIGSTATEKLIEMINGRQVKPNLMPVELKLRESFRVNKGD